MDDTDDEPRPDEPASDLPDRKGDGELKPDPRDVFQPIKEGEFKNEDVVLSEETVALLRKRSGGLIKKTKKIQRTDWNSPKDLRGCFLCVMILEDFGLHGKLTGWPLDTFEKGTFPVEAKVGHIRLEKHGS